MRTQAASVNKLYKYVIYISHYLLLIHELECWKIHRFIILSRGLRMANYSVSAILHLSLKSFFLNTLNIIIGKVLSVNSIVSDRSDRIQCFRYLIVDSSVWVS